MVVRDFTGLDGDQFHKNLGDITQTSSQGRNLVRDIARMSSVLVLLWYPSLLCP